MQTITPDQLQELAKAAGLKSRLRQDLRHPQDGSDWAEREYTAISDRSGNKGVLLVELDEGLFLIPFEIMRGITDLHTGRRKPIICDFCFTWQAGANAARISFRRASDRHLLSFLCCADLQCSDHVRTKTPEAQKSRAQLREDLDVEQRVARLLQKLGLLVDALGLMPIKSL